MLKINLLKPGIMIYDDSNPGGIIDTKRELKKPIHRPDLVEVFWDKKSFIECMGEKEERE